MGIDLSGHWVFEGDPAGTRHKGQIEIDLVQSGDEISGELIQKINPVTGLPPDDPELTRAKVDGELMYDPRNMCHLVILKRTNINTRFRAIFAGTLDENAKTINGYFVNTIPGGGAFIMRKMSDPPNAGKS
jgi:hypothetical protein